MGPEAKSAVPVLAAIVREKSVKPGLRHAAADALGEIGSAAKESIPDLNKAKVESDVGPAAAEALEKIQGD